MEILEGAGRRRKEKGGDIYRMVVGWCVQYFMREREREALVLLMILVP